MKYRYSLSTKNSPRGLHLSFYAVIWLLMDRWNPASWIWGVVGTLCAVIFICHVIDFFTAKEIELADLVNKK